MILKQNSKVLREKTTSLFKVRQSNIVRKVLVMLFFDVQRLVYHHMFKNGQ